MFIEKFKWTLQNLEFEYRMEQSNCFKPCGPTSIGTVVQSRPYFPFLGFYGCNPRSYTFTGFVSFIFESFVSDATRSSIWWLMYLKLFQEYTSYEVLVPSSIQKQTWIAVGCMTTFAIGKGTWWYTSHWNELVLWYVEIAF